MIGVYGGTFDPVHFGHLRTALEVFQDFCLEELKLIPCRLPAHRDQPGASAEHRCAMLTLAITDCSGLAVDRRELERDGPSYMVDTLASIRAEIGDQPLALFIGGDAFLSLTYWHRWRALFDYAHIIVMTRPGYSEPELNHFFYSRRCTDVQRLTTQPSGQLCFHPVTALDISASKIREAIAKGQNPKFLTADKVLAYIDEQALYRYAQAGQNPA
ncbi:MAG: nicotinate-nucleotide adenylyltransferase [Methylococcales bacterium]|nr:nicotinate-nucleotide adenylyltransferase [Methylococcales bacterium]